MILIRNNPLQKGVQYNSPNRTQTKKQERKHNQLASLTSLSAPSFGILPNKTKALKNGVTYDKKTKELSFSIPSKNATQINLYLFDKPTNSKVITSHEMTKQGDSWVYTLSKQEQEELGLNIEGKTPLYYGYRAWGPNWEYDKNWTPGSDIGFISHVDNYGNRFNPNKLLFDPYAREISHDPVSPKAQKTEVKDEIYTTGDENYLMDTSKVAPKGVFILSDDISTGIKPKRALKDDVIYEVHLRGFSMLDEKIPKKYRGTYKGAALKAKYLKNLGITMVEFLPVQEFDDDRNDFQNTGTNYWGYQPINYFAPNKRYSSDKTPGGAIREFKEMVKAFHDEGIKVCMDVVYNHTGEGGIWGDTDKATVFTMRGVDNTSYYETTSDGRHFWDNSGCGSNFNCANNLASDLVAESLKYWAQDMGVDAFRFDLASVLINDKEKGGYNFNPEGSKLLKKLNRELDIRTPDGKKGSVDLIAEPWGCGEGTYQVGNFPNNWSEWNDSYRDIVRKMLNRQENTSFADIVRVLAGSDDKFRSDKTRAINFITCHDGFTMKDLFSYNEPFNHNPEFLSDGGTQGESNNSWDNFGDKKRQKQAMRNAFLILMMSKGVPMILGGDEIMRTQFGNNNAYCLDTEKNYIDWSMDEDKKSMQEFVKSAIHFRLNHKALRNVNFYNGFDNNNNNIKDVTWHKANSEEADGYYLDNPHNSFIGARIDETEYDNKGATSIYFGINKGDCDITITLPQNTQGKNWYIAADTSKYSPIKNNFAKEGEEIPAPSHIKVDARSSVLFIEK